MTKPKLYYYQYCFTVALFCAAGIFLPGIVRNTAGTGAFCSFALALLPGMLILAMTAFVFRNGKGPLDAYAFCFGRAVSRVVCVINSVYFIYIAAELMAFYALYAAYASQMSSPVLFLLPVMLGVCFAAAKRSASIGRMAVIIGGMMLAVSAFFLVFSVFGGRPENLFPVVSVPADTLFTVTFSLAALEFAQLSAVLCLSGALRDRKKLIKSTLLSALAGNAAVLIVAFMSVYLNGQTTMINRVGYSPGYTAGGGLGGLKILAAAALFFSAVFRAAVCLRAAGICAGEALGIKKRRTLIYPMGAAVFAVSALLMTGIAGLSEFVIKYAWLVCLPAGAAIPFIAFIFAAVKKARRRKNAKSRVVPE